MAIATAIEKNGFVEVYDEKGRTLAVIGAGSGRDDGLQGYTTTTVSIRRAGLIHIYDERGRSKSVVAAR